MTANITEPFDPCSTQINDSYRGLLFVGVHTTPSGKSVVRLGWPVWGREYRLPMVREQQVCGHLGQVRWWAPDVRGCGWVWSGPAITPQPTNSRDVTNSKWRHLCSYIFIILFHFSIFDTTIAFFLCFSSFNIVFHFSIIIIFYFPYSQFVIVYWSLP